MLYPKPLKLNLTEEYLNIEKLTVCGACADTFVEAARIFGYAAEAVRDRAAVTVWVDGNLAPFPEAVRPHHVGYGHPIDGFVRYELKPHKVFLFEKDTEERIRY